MFKVLLERDGARRPLRAFLPVKALWDVTTEARQVEKSALLMFDDALVSQAHVLNTRLPSVRRVRSLMQCKSSE